MSEVVCLNDKTKVEPFCLNDTLIFIRNNFLILTCFKTGFIFEPFIAKNYSMANKTEKENEVKTNPNAAQQNLDAANSNVEKNPDEWTTGGEPMTGAQKSYLKTLSDEAGEEMNNDLTKAEASKRIDELQHKTGRGLNN